MCIRTDADWIYVQNPSDADADLSRDQN